MKFLLEIVFLFSIAKEEYTKIDILGVQFIHVYRFVRCIFMRESLFPFRLLAQWKKNIGTIHIHVT